MDSSFSINITNSNIYSNNNYGIYSYFVDGNNIADNKIYSNSFGIYFTSGNDNNNIINNEIYSNANYGFYSSSSTYNKLDNNTIRNNNNYGVYLNSGSNYDTITNNSIYSNTNYGIYMPSSSYNNIENNTIRNNNNYGLYLSSSSYNRIENNSIYLNTNYGIYTYSSSNNQITNNNINNSDYGIYLYYYSSNNNLIKNNIFSINSGGFWNYYYSTNNILENCTISSAQYDLYIDYYSNAITINMTINDSKLYVATDSKLTVKNYLEVLTIDNQTNPISDSKIYVKENNDLLYSYDSPAMNFIDINNNGTAIGTGDDAYYSSIPIGFTLNFYGNNYTQFDISTNGFISFDTLANAYLSNIAIPNTNLPNNIIAICWDDLNVVSGEGNMYYRTFGSSPNRYIVIEWYNVSRVGVVGTNRATFEMILYETTNNIKFQYQTMYFGNTAYDYGKDATSGIENLTGGKGLQYSYNQPFLTNGLTIEFHQYYLTDSNGLAYWILLTDRVYENGDITEWNGSAYATHNYFGFINNPRDVNMSSSHRETFIGDALPKAVSLSYDSITNSSVNLTWTQNNDTDFKNYTVYLSTNNATWQKIAEFSTKTTTKYEVDNLTENTKYYFKVRVYDVKGLYNDSNVVNLLTENIPPIAVNLSYTNLKATTVDLSWTKNNEHDFKNYTVQKALDNSTWTDVVKIVNKNTLSYTATLEENTKYYFRVRVYDTADAFNDSNVVNFTTPNGNPTAVSLNYLLLTPYSVNLTWNKNNNNDFVNYTVYISTDGINWNNISVITDNSTTKYTANALTENTRYYFKVRVYDNGSLFADSNILSITTQNLPPNALALSYSSFTAYAVNLTWNKSTDKDFKEYVIYKSSDNITWIPIPPITNISTIYWNYGGLKEDTQYFFKIKVRDTAGNLSLDSNILAIRTVNLLPNAVFLTNGTITSNSVVLNWIQNQNLDFANYTIYLSYDNSSWQKIISIENKTTLTYNVQNLEDNIKHYFMARVYDNGNAYNDSNIVIITTINVKPNNITLSYYNLTAFSVNLTWNENKNMDFSNYTIYLSSNGINWQTLKIISNNSTAFLLRTNLTENTKYYYKIITYDKGGLFAESSIINMTTLNGIPNITYLYYSSLTYNSVVLNWYKNNNIDFKNYTLQKSFDNSTWEELSVITNKNTIIHTTSIEEGKKYYFRVIVYDKGNLSSNSNVIEILVESKVPSSVVLSYDAPTSSSVNLKWTKGIDTDFKNYTIYMSSDNLTWQEIKIITENNLLSFNVQNLEEYTNYYFKIITYDYANQKNESNIIKIKTLNIPPKQTVVSNFVVTENSIEISWKKNDDADFNNYTIYIYEDSKNTTPKTYEITDRNKTNYNITNLNEDTIYIVIVRVYDTKGGYSDSYEQSKKTTAKEVPIKPIIQEEKEFPIIYIVIIIIVVVIAGIGGGGFFIYKMRKKEPMPPPPSRPPKQMIPPPPPMEQQYQQPPPPPEEELPPQPPMPPPPPPPEEE